MRRGKSGHDDQDRDGQGQGEWQGGKAGRHGRTGSLFRGRPLAMMRGNNRAMVEVCSGMPCTTPHRKPLRRVAAALLAALWLLAVPVAPVSAGLFGGDEEALGAQEHPKILAQFGGEYRDAQVQAYVAGIGQRLAAVTERPEGPWTFTVLDSDVVNAFALPGGYVYITRGLLALAKDEAEVASVVAHEMGHVTGQHSSQRQTRSTIAELLSLGVGILLGSPELAQLAGLGSSAVLAGYSRGQETDADRRGVAYLHRAGYDPFAMATFLETMRRYEQYQSLRAGQEEGGFSFFSTHPRTESRVEEAAVLARDLPGGVRPVEPYLAAVDNLIYGDSPENGFVRGQTFAHPALGLAFSVPAGFSLLNGTDQVIAKGPGGVAILFDGGRVGNVASPVDYLTQVWARGSPLSAVEPITIDGLPAATAVTRGEAGQEAVDLRLVAIRFDADSIYRFVFLAPVGTLGRYDRAFQETANSFHRLTRQEAAGLQPRRIRVVAVRPGEAVESLVARMPQEPYAEELFRIINDIPPGTPLQPGQGVKIITGG